MYEKYLVRVPSDTEGVTTKKINNTRYVYYVYGREYLSDKKYSKPQNDLLPDLMLYSIICESNAARYYPDYGYDHLLFDSGMHIYSESKISDFRRKITVELI